ncbi:B- and T-lymphocyte attenuator isoform X1 [Acanthopagrus latus]|uniref:B- and T-lymphocyte attenuator isoform X1 n=1 Tax=Acanthopagrus latus TaxID=8177 RepID=UPI00187CE0D7|nr:B- and T-lymphocyte attenuator isoform X1 [Acanthopagrus latus]
MKMSSLMDKLPHTSLLIFYCVTCVCVYGGDVSPPCEVGLMVRRGTTWTAAPRQRVTVKCPVKDCGEPLSVTWCKLSDTDRCERIHQTENVQQNDKRVKDELVSFLTFKRISIHNDGLYGCSLKGYKFEMISHTINISVSDSYHGVKQSVDTTDESPSVAGDEDPSWLPYFYICAGIALLVTTLIVFTLLSFHGRKRVQTFNHNKGQEMSNHTIPNLPKDSSPSSLFLQTHFPFRNDFHPPSPAERPPSQLPMMTGGNQQPAAGNTADGSQASDRAVYAAINHPQSGVAAREQHTATEQNKKAEYAVVKVP